MRHAAEDVVLLKDENAPSAKLGEHSGGGQSADSGSDHDDVGFLVRSH